MRREWGSGTICRRADGRYQARVELPPVNGRRRQRTALADTEDEARRKLRKLRESNGSRSPLSTDLTVGEWLERWLHDLAVRPRTRAGYRSIVDRHLRPDMGAVPLALLSVSDVRGFARRQLGRGLRPRTVGHHLACLRTALAAAARDELIPRNPAALVPSPKVERVEKRTLSEQDVTALLEAVKGDRLEALYVLAAYTGMRQGELLGLRWDAVDLQKGEVHVRQSLSWVNGRPAIVPPKTQRSRRTIPLEQPAIEVMTAHRKRALLADPELQQGLVFATPAGSPIAGWRATLDMQKHLRAAGLPKVGFHALRHACASRWANKGMPPKLLMTMLGHAQIATTFELYAHTTTEDIREAMRRLA